MKYLEMGLVITGGVLSSAGAAWAYPPAGLMVAGVFLIWFFKPEAS